MKTWRIPVVFAAGVLAGCMASGPPLPAETPAGPSGPSSPLGSPFAQRPQLAGAPWYPLILDRTDVRIGTTVQFSRIPTVSELHDLTLLPGLAHLVLSLPAWPAEYAPLQALNQAPEGVDVIVVLPGYPPSRAATDAWSYVQAQLRVVLVVPGPPPSVHTIEDLNAMPGLERVIAQMDEPSRSGFQRLQRPLSFRKLIE
jgi:hypothetical protein